MDFVTELSGTLWEQYRAGGPVMHLILACSLLSASAIVYKALVFRSCRADLAALIGGVRRAVERGRFGEAGEVCERHRGPVAVALKVGLLHRSLPRDELERHIDSAEIAELEHLERFLGVLATITTIAPLIGFFGTVIGMIESFSALATTGMGDPAKVAAGISVALITTAFGLLVAFFTQPFLNYFVGRIRSFENQIEVARIALLDALATAERAGLADR